MPSFDAIIIGGGHNGLIAAAYLGRAGLRALVLERRPILGGASITEEIHPGFRVSTLAYACGLLRSEIKEELELERFGLDERPYDPSQFLPLRAPPVSLADLVSLVRTPEAEDFLRQLMLRSVADLLDDFFESDEVKASFATRDRKSTRLNSSHGYISYAV